MTPVLLSGPTLEPLTLEEARLWLRLDTTEEDVLVTALIRAARIAVEQATRRALISQKWRLRLDRWPVDRFFALPLSPILSLDAVRVFDAAGLARAQDLTSFALDQSGPPRLWIDGAVTPVGRLRNGIEIDVTAGFGATAALVPDPLQLAMRQLVVHWYERRGDALHERREPGLPAAVAAMIAPYRRMRVS